MRYGWCNALTKRNRQRKQFKKMSVKMQQKLAVLLGMILVAFVFLALQLYRINKDKGDIYKKQVLSQQSYDSIVLPAKRGEIIDRNGTKIAVSQKVYNVVIDSKTLNMEQGTYLDPTLNSLYSTDIDFNFTKEELRSFITENPGSQYRVVAKKQSYDVVNPLMDIINNPTEHPDFKGVWLEDTYQRTYPYNSLACDLIGFVQGDNEGAYGLEEFYNDTLVGINGREYGYLNDDENVERTVKPAQDGKTLVTSIDVNIQSIVEKHIAKFNEEHKNEVREGNGASNIGVMIMDPNNGEVLAMASYPTYDLNNPRDITGMEIDVELDPENFKNAENASGDEEGSEEGNEEVKDEAQSDSESGEVKQDEEGQEETVQTDGSTLDEAGKAVTEEDEDVTKESLNEKAEELMKDPEQDLTYDEAYELAYEEAKMEKLNALWKNFCITSTYEPGSTMKPFTMALGLEEGKLKGDESYECNGVLEVGDHQIHCANRFGHGILTFSGALEQSCNVALMKMAAAIGKETFMKYNEIFNFGLKTNVDLTGEALTNSLVFDVNTMTPTDLAISSFGQGFNVTMVQMITGFCSLINGGYYYKPHVVTKVLDSDGAIVQNVEPRVLKQTISEETSAKIKQLCINVVELGTGSSARPAGYRIGGKTGTAEKYPRGQGNYVVSFMGFAPADNPQLVIYVVIDEPNVEKQASSRYATIMCKDILTEVLPYLDVFQTEALTEEESQELSEKQKEFSEASNDVTENAEGTSENGGTEEGVANGEQVEKEDEYLAGGAEEDAIETDDANAEKTQEEEEKPVIQFDDDTGYAIEPGTGILLDPNTGQPVDSNVSDLE